MSCGKVKCMHGSAGDEMEGSEEEYEVCWCEL